MVLRSEFQVRNTVNGYVRPGVAGPVVAPTSIRKDVYTAVGPSLSLIQDWSFHMEPPISLL